MKYLALLFGLTFASMAQAGEAPRFSAFASGNDLFVTILGDSCNSFGGSLEVAAFCKEGRSTTNYVTQCTADLVVRSTKMACFDKKKAPKVLEMSLREVAAEAQTLVLKYDDQEIEIKL